MENIPLSGAASQLTSVLEATAGWRICDVLDASGPPGHTSTMGEKTKLEVMEPSR